MNLDQAVTARKPRLAKLKAFRGYQPLQFADFYSIAEKAYNLTSGAMIVKQFLGAGLAWAILATVAHSQETGLAQITSAQHDKIVSALDTIPSSYMPTLSNARNNIGQYMAALSCEQKWNGMALNVYLAPDSVGAGALAKPMMPMDYHNKNQCVDLVRFQGWKQLAANAYQFQAVFLATDSSESVTTTHQLLRQPDGTWLFHM